MPRSTKAEICGSAWVTGCRLFKKLRADPASGTYKFDLTPTDGLSDYKRRFTGRLATTSAKLGAEWFATPFS